MQYHDVTLPVTSGMVVWPGHPPVEVARLSEIGKGSDCNVSRLEMDCHAGTHVDAACHFLESGAGVDAIPPEVLIGPAYVADAGEAEAGEADAGEADILSAELLDALAIPEGTERLILKTRNSAYWASMDSPFREDYVGLDLGGARWIADRGVRLVGTDYLSVALLAEAAPVHRLLLGAGVVPLEGLDLRRIAAGWYRLICLPMKLAGCDGAPARAVLVEE